MSPYKIQSEILKDYINHKTKDKSFKWYIDRRDPDNILLSPDGVVIVTIPRNQWALDRVFDDKEDCKIFKEIIRCETARYNKPMSLTCTEEVIERNGDILRILLTESNLEIHVNDSKLTKYFDVDRCLFYQQESRPTYPVIVSDEEMNIIGSICPVNVR